jgi:N-acetylmuramoyl-L-alanine amidase
MSAIRRYAVAAALIGVTSLAACGTTPASQPGPTTSPSPATSTPTGRFHIYWRYSNGWQPGPLGSMYRPNYFSAGYAVHGMTSVPPYPASHGCVRMTVPTMDRMWSSLWVGMPVAIYSS